MFVCVSAHRTKSYANNRKPALSSMKRRDSSKEGRSPSDTQSPTETATTSPITSSQSNDEPLVSERAGYGDHDSDSQDDSRRVQFTEKNVSQKADIVDIPENDSYDDENPQDEHRKRKG